ncbi:MAG: S1 RNA-binding domain-containing protein [Acutalibacteraceae bacterium]|jgi:S1 RNA binding domain protein
MQFEVGAVFNGKVTGLTNFGAFVEMETGDTGMVHISEVASTYVDDIKDHLVLNQEVKVKVLGVTPDGKISLSIKKASEDFDEESKSSPKSAPAKRPAPNIWQGPKSTQLPEDPTFEEMMARFKKVSEEKMTDIKHSKEAKNGGGYSRRGGRR